MELENLRSRQKMLSDDLDQKFHDIIGVSSSIQKVFNTIEKVAATDANILILGENGTGKELVARAIHRQSNRSKDVFISVDMGAISQSLFESELFGHVKGSFTDAKENRAGRFEAASGGTLFLDEIGNIPVELQVKLLNVLETREVSRVGSNKKNPVDIRLICATNEDIHKSVSDNRFRQDLLYRINTVEIHLSPLRERPEDVPLLSEHFLNIFKKKYNKADITISTETMQKLQHYNWPGNIRELQHAIERAIILSENKELQPSDFFFSAGAQTELEIGFESYNLEEIEKNIIRKVLSKYEGNVTKAAKELGLTRTSLYRRMEKFGF